MAAPTAPGLTEPADVPHVPLAGHTTTQDRPLWWVQILIAVGFVIGYGEIRDLHGHVAATAIAHGRELLHIDHVLHLAWTAPVSNWADSHDTVADLVSVYYVVMHFGMVSLALLLLWIQGREYRRQRDVLIVLSLIGLVVYWLYPAAPPRLLPGGLSNTVATHIHIAGSLESTAADVYASMPSLHVAWAIWAAVALGSLTTRRWLRALLALHPVLTTLAVLMTANHYMIDVLAGAALAGLAYPVTWCLRRAKGWLVGQIGRHQRLLTQ